MQVAADGTAGSGCTPDTDALPDGVWFGFIDDFTRTSITFDLVCLRFSYDDGFEEWQVTNSNPRLRATPLDVEAIASVNVGGPDLSSGYRFSEFESVYAALPSSDRGAFIEIVNGRLVRVEVPFRS